MAVFFTADTHFGHENIIRYQNRPFQSVGEMDGKMIEWWNERVRGNDVVYHLGDFFWKIEQRIVERLMGKIVVIPGGHDSKWVRKYVGVRSASGQVMEVTSDIEVIGLEGKRIVLCHYPIESWERMRQGAVHFHGHSHGKCRKIVGRVDVGADCWGLVPIGAREVLRRALEG